MLPPAQMSTVMPRFYFHIDDDRTHIDHVGVELPDLEAARAEAVSAAGQILRRRREKSLERKTLAHVGYAVARSQRKSRFLSFAFLRRKNDRGGVDVPSAQNAC